MSALPPIIKPLGEKPELSYTLPSEYYLSPEVYEYEKEKIFYRIWQYIMHEVMLPDPGDYITVHICDENIFVIRSADGKLRAFYNVCRHRAHELLKGEGNVRKLIVCPYHAWSYDNSGNLKAARMSDGRPGFDKTEFGLCEIRLELFCGCIFVNLDDKAESLQSIAADLEADIRKQLPYLDKLQVAGTNLLGETEMAAGWKVVVDNFVECYHCRSAHRDFASLIDMKSYQVDLLDYWSRQMGPNIHYNNSAYPVDPKYGMQKSVFWYLWPNTTFNVLHGSDELTVFAIRPIDIKTSSFGGQTLNVESKIYQPRADYASKILAPEDISLCESVQRGLASKSYDQGTFIVNPDNPGESEHALHHFHRLVQQALA